MALYQTYYPSGWFDPSGNPGVEQSPQGWQCPLCHRVYAPFVKECDRCNQPIDEYSDSAAVRTTVHYITQQVPTGYVYDGTIT